MLDEQLFRIGCPEPKSGRLPDFVCLPLLPASNLLGFLFPVVFSSFLRTAVACLASVASVAFTRHTEFSNYILVVVVSFVWWQTAL